ncbi:hypothetical protein NA57DRAFT_53521 [Rhizodiscina lignyota]|uniref:Uncharacterized protein n=1 Tax=Rhizodiscina lignyota TaxID=1504668 RepID=A0A9P4INW7_9PEZI|nr:hypothetical protein NA57DRAFT_53521 [Rhizodiscina lignyota]
MGFTPTSIVRWVSWVPWGYFGFSAITMYTTIKGHDELKVAPYPSNLFTGQALAGIVGVLGIAWCFIAFAVDGFLWVNSFGKSGSSPAFTIISLIIDTTFSGCLLAAAAIQATYLPGTLSGCSSAESSDLFHAVGKLEKKSPHQACEDFVTVWIWTIVMGYAFRILSV